ncbi:MAG: hypothetical protein Q7R52_02015 [archaeon]|nr:hypothetical protein [archaeon]
MINEPSKLLKIANYFGDLKEDIYKFGSEVFPLPNAVNEVQGFMIYRIRPLCIGTVHYDMGNESIAKSGYNLILNILSRSPEMNDFVAEEFSNKTGIILRDALDSLYNFLEKDGMSSLAFRLCENGGEKAMKILREKLQ